MHPDDGEQVGAPSRSSLSGRVRAGAARQLVARLFSSLVSFVITAVVLARVLPEAEYGVFNFYLTLFLLVMTLVDFGINRAAIRMVAAGELERDRAIAAAVVLKAAFGVTAFLAMAAFIAWAEAGLGTRLLLCLAAAHAMFHGFSGASVGYEVDVDYRIPSRAVIVGYSVFLIGGLALAGGAVRAAPPYLVAFGAGLAVQNLVVFAASRVGGVVRRVDRSLLTRLFRESLPLGISAVSVSIYFYADTIMLRPLRGDEDVAEYSVAYRLMSFGLMVPVLFSQVLFPVFTRCHERSRELLHRAVRRATFYLAVVGGLAGALLFVAAGPLLQWVFGGEYARSAPVLRILSAAMAVVYLTYPHSTALISAGRAATFTRITIASACLNVGLNLALLPSLGPRGAAITTLVTEVFVLAASVVSLYRFRKITGWSRDLIGPAVASLALGGALYAAGAHHRSGWVAIVVAALVAAPALVVLRVLPFRLDVEEEELQ